MCFVKYKKTHTQKIIRYCKFCDLESFRIVICDFGVLLRAFLLAALCRSFWIREGLGFLFTFEFSSLNAISGLLVLSVCEWSCSILCRHACVFHDNLTLWLRFDTGLTLCCDDCTAFVIVCLIGEEYGLTAAKGLIQRIVQNVIYPVMHLFMCPHQLLWFVQMLK